jgi:hypothetical protein
MPRSEYPTQIVIDPADMTRFREVQETAKEQGVSLEEAIILLVNHALSVPPHTPVDTKRFKIAGHVTYRFTAEVEAEDEAAAQDENFEDFADFEIDEYDPVELIVDEVEAIDDDPFGDHDEVFDLVGEVEGVDDDNEYDEIDPDAGEKLRALAAAVDEITGAK